MGGPRLARGRTGQALVEFTIAVPLFMLLLLGVLDFGRIGFYYVATSALARGGARYAAVYNNGYGFTDCEIVANVKQQTDAATMANLTEPGGCTVPAAPGNTTPPRPLTAPYQPAPGNAYIFIDRSNSSFVTVSIVFAFQPTTPMINSLTGTIYAIATSSMNTEY